MWEKRTLLEALSANPNTKPEEIKALVREISELRGQMQTKHDALQTRVTKEVGIDLPMGFGRHDGRQGKGGHGRGKGDFGSRGMGRGMNANPDAAPTAPDA